jgi:hypothetical protein
MKTYNLGSSDMDAILPVSDVRNPRNYLMRVKAYNVRDVVALARRIRSSSQASGSSTGLTVANGSNIMRTTAMKEFGVCSSNIPVWFSRLTVSP